MRRKRDTRDRDAPPERLTRWRREEWPEYDNAWDAHGEWSQQVRAWADAHHGDVLPVGAVEVYQMLAAARRQLRPPPERRAEQRRALREAFERQAAAVYAAHPSAVWVQTGDDRTEEERRGDRAAMIKRAEAGLPDHLDPDDWPGPA